MKKVFVVFALCCSCCFASWNTFETRQQAYDRQSARNYQTYESNNYQAPLGGYRQPLGSSTSGEQYGFNNRNNSYNSYNSGNSLNSRSSRSSFNNW